jgi:aryl-alcohol dehydrogenase-like predicted oxidoreductase
MSRIPGRATAEATRRFAERAVGDARAHAAAYSRLDGLTISSVGVGTYLGDADDETDLLYTESILEAVRLGCNAVDTAVNYRYQRSERAVGEALGRAVATGLVSRDEIVVATKGGYVPFDGGPPSGPREFKEYLERSFFEPGACAPADMAVRLQHCLAPGFLSLMIDWSRENLGLECLDVYYLHNPESQLPEVGPETFERRMRDAFAALEAKVADGAIARYGTATWNGYRKEPGDRDYLSLSRLVEIAREVAGDGHHFRVVQLPFNLAMPEAYGLYNQEVDGEMLPLLDAAGRLGVAVVASASLQQAQLAEGLPPEISEAVPGATDAQRAIEFCRSTPGVTTALVGMSRPAHVRENLALLTRAPAAPDAIRSLFEEPGE